VPDVTKCVSQFVLIFIKREKFSYIYSQYFLLLFHQHRKHLCLRTTSPKRPTVPQGAEIEEEEPDHDIIYLSFQPWWMMWDEVLRLKERVSLTANMFRPKEQKLIWGRKKYTLRTFIVCTLSTMLGRLKSGRRDGPDMFRACRGGKYAKGFHTIPRGENNVQLLRWYEHWSGT